jgi:hypothetical protein
MKYPFVTGKGDSKWNRVLLLGDYNTVILAVSKNEDGFFVCDENYSTRGVNIIMKDNLMTGWNHVAIVYNNEES